MSTKFYFYIGILFLGLIFGSGICSEFLPSPITKCKFNDESCYIEQTKRVFKLIKSGVPELNIEPSDPISLQNIEVASKNDGPTTLNLNLTDTQLYNWSEGTVNSIKGFHIQQDKSIKMFVNITFPHLKFKAKYSIRGKVLILPIIGEGLAEMDSYDSLDRIAITFKTEQREDGKNYLHAQKCKILTEAKNAHINMSNLFNGDQALSENILKVMNDNWSLFLNDFVSPVNKVFGEKIINVVNKLLKNIAFEDLFSDDASVQSN